MSIIRLITEWNPFHTRDRPKSIAQSIAIVLACIPFPESWLYARLYVKHEFSEDSHCNTCMILELYCLSIDIGQSSSLLCSHELLVNIWMCPDLQGHFTLIWQKNMNFLAESYILSFLKFLFQWNTNSLKDRRWTALRKIESQFLYKSFSDLSIVWAYMDAHLPNAIGIYCIPIDYSNPICSSATWISHNSVHTHVV